MRPLICISSPKPPCFNHVAERSDTMWFKAACLHYWNIIAAHFHMHLYYSNLAWLSLSCQSATVIAKNSSKKWLKRPALGVDRKKQHPEQFLAYIPIPLLCAATMIDVPQQCQFEFRCRQPTNGLELCPYKMPSSNPVLPEKHMALYT